MHNYQEVRVQEKKLERSGTLFFLIQNELKSKCTKLTLAISVMMEIALSFLLGHNQIEGKQQ